MLEKAAGICLGIVTLLAFGIVGVVRFIPDAGATCVSSGCSDFGRRSSGCVHGTSICDIEWIEDARGLFDSSKEPSSRRPSRRQTFAVCLLALIGQIPLFTRWSDAMWYCADIGPSVGLLMFADSMRRINVLEELDESSAVGTASRLGSDPAGLAVWRLNVRGAELGGRWIVIDRRFVPARSPLT